MHLDTFFDSKLSKNFIIACSRGCIKAYDYNENKLYKIFGDDVLKKVMGIDLLIFVSEKKMKLQN